MNVADNTPVKSFTWFEMIMGTTVVMLIISVKSFNEYRATLEPWLALTGLILGFSYLAANWWLSKPAERSLRTVIVTLVYGVASAVLMFAVVFRMLNLSGTDQMAFLAIMLLIISIVTDLIFSIGKKVVINKVIFWRLTILVVIVVVYFILEDGLDNLLAAPLV